MSVYQDNAKAIEQFRKELMSMLGDIQNIDKKVLNQAVNEGVAFAKRHTPVGDHPNPVTFTTKNPRVVDFTTKKGKKVHFVVKAGKAVSFKIDNPGIGGFLIKSWHKMPTKRTADGLEAELVYSAEYASFWNDGHNIKNKKDGPSKGWQKGTYVLEDTKKYLNKRLAELFEKEVKAVQEKHDK